MAETLEQKVNGHKAEEKKEGSELAQLFKGVANTSIGAAAIGASYALLGTTGLAIASAAPLSGRIVTKLAGTEYTTAQILEMIRLQEQLQRHYLWEYSMP